MSKYDLARFSRAQDAHYETALSELRKGKKKTHWMWYIFPQLRELGFSETSKYYGIENVEEAKMYLETSPYNVRLLDACNVLLRLETRNAVKVFGEVDAKKLQSSMTLFSIASENKIMSMVFKEVLTKFYKGKYCQRTKDILEREKQHA